MDELESESYSTNNSTIQTEATNKTKAISLKYSIPSVTEIHKESLEVSIEKEFDENLEEEIICPESLKQLKTDSSVNLTEFSIQSVREIPKELSKSSKEKELDEELKTKTIQTNTNKEPTTSALEFLVKSSMSTVTEIQKDALIDEVIFSPLSLGLSWDFPTPKKPPRR